MGRRYPSLPRSYVTNVDALKEQRESTHVDLKRIASARQVTRKREFSGLEPLVDDRESSMRPHEHLHVGAQTIEKHEHVTRKRISTEYVLHDVR